MGKKSQIDAEREQILSTRHDAMCHRLAEELRSVGSRVIREAKLGSGYADLLSLDSPPEPDFHFCDCLGTGDLSFDWDKFGAVWDRALVYESRELALDAIPKVLLPNRRCCSDIHICKDTYPRPVTLWEVKSFHVVSSGEVLRQLSAYERAENWPEGPRGPHLPAWSFTWRLLGEQNIGSLFRVLVCPSISEEARSQLEAEGVGIYLLDF